MRTSSAAGQLITCTPLAVLLVLLPLVVATAQEPVKSFDQLNTRLKVGDTVWVMDMQGQETKGKVRDLGPSSLSLSADDSRPISSSDIRQIRVKRPDSVANGILIGAGIGIAGGLLISMGGSESLMEPQYGLALGITVGAGVGLAVDALRSGKKELVYRAPGASGHARLSLAPIIAPRTKAVAVSFSF